MHTLNDDNIIDNLWGVWSQGLCKCLSSTVLTVPQVG